MQLLNTIQSPAAAAVAASLIEANSSIVCWDLSYNAAIEGQFSMEES